MKKIVPVIMFLAFAANVSAQLKVKRRGMKALIYLLFVPLALSTVAACSGDKVTEFIACHDSGIDPPLVLTIADFNIPAGCFMNKTNMQRDSVYVINSEEE
jgi:hypothetical protein